MEKLNRASFYLVRFHGDDRNAIVGVIIEKAGVLVDAAFNVYRHEPIVAKINVTEDKYRETLYVLRDDSAIAYGGDADLWRRRMKKRFPFISFEGPYGVPCSIKRVTSIDVSSAAAIMLDFFSV